MSGTTLEPVNQPASTVPIIGTIGAGPHIKIAMLVPTQLAVDVRWAFTFQNILAQLPPGSSYFADYRYGLAETREALITQAIVTIPDLTHILFVDTDVIPLIPNGVQLLLSDNKDIVSGIYFSSLMTGVAAWKGVPNQDPNTKEQMPIVELPIAIDNVPYLQEVDKSGFGFTLIKKEVFSFLEEKKEPRPWFYYLIDGSDRKMQSEDFYFLDKCKKYGIKPWVDLRVQCGHIKTMIINPNGQVQAPPAQNAQPTAAAQK